MSRKFWQFGDFNFFALMPNEIVLQFDAIAIGSKNLWKLLFLHAVKKGFFYDVSIKTVSQIQYRNGMYFWKM